MKLPHNSEAERSVAGAIMVDNSVLVDVIGEVEFGDFLEPRTGLVFEAATALFDENSAVDYVTVCEKLLSTGKLEAAGGKDAVCELAGAVITSANTAHYARLVRADSKRRALIALCHNTIKELEECSEHPDEIVDALVVHSQSIMEKKREPEGVGDIVAKITDAWERGVEFNPPIRTHLAELNEKIAGFNRGDMVVIAGRPSMGKTTLAMNFAEHVAVDLNLPVAVFSLETDAAQIVCNVISSRAGIDQSLFVGGKPPAENWPALSRSAAAVSESRLAIHEDTASTLSSIRAICRRMERAHGQLGLVVVDYLQLMEGPKAESRQREVSTLSRGMKGLARSLDAPLIAVCQLSRAVEQRSPPIPRLSDLRESGAIEQDADKVILLYRDEYYNPQSEDHGVAELHVAKNRSGPTGIVRASFVAKHLRFRDLARKYTAGSQF